MDYILISVGLIGLIFATITDLRTREVPDWLNYSLIATGLGLRLIYSIGTGDWLYFLYGLGGFGIFFLVAALMFYTGQWGGGDSKLLMGMGALFGTVPSMFAPKIISFFPIAFFINLLFFGAIYGMLFTIYLALRRWKAFRRNYYLKLKKFKGAHVMLLGVTILLFVLVYIIPRFEIWISFSVLLVVVLSMYVYAFIKSVEEECMIKTVRVSELTEGDWIVDDVVIKGKRITGPRDLGIEKKQIEELVKLAGKTKKIKIKEGIPFVPSFLIGFLFTLFYGNVIFLFLSL